MSETQASYREAVKAMTLQNSRMNELLVEIGDLKERVESLRATLELCEGSIRAAIAKADDAPMSADAHLSEALRACELVIGIPGEKYSAGAANLRGIVAEVECLTRERDAAHVSTKSRLDAAETELEAIRHTSDCFARDLVAADRKAAEFADIANIRGQILERRGKLLERWLEWSGLIARHGDGNLVRETEEELQK